MIDELRQRQPRETDPAFLAFLRTKRCAGCNAPPPVVQAAHVRMGSIAYAKRETGKGEKPSDRWAVPLCIDCHMEDQHKGAEMKFWRRLGIDPFALAIRFYTEFEKIRPVKRGVESGRAGKASRPRLARSFTSSINKSKPKRKWPSKALRSASRWPKGRKLGSK